MWSTSAELACRRDKIGLRLRAFEGLVGRVSVTRYPSYLVSGHNLGLGYEIWIFFEKFSRKIFFRTTQSAGGWAFVRMDKIMGEQLRSAQLKSSKIVKIVNLMIFRRAMGGVRVLKTRWKYHKSRDHNFLHRSYTSKKISAPKKNILLPTQKKFFENVRKSSAKNSKIENCRISQMSILVTKKCRFFSVDFWSEKISIDQFFFEVEKNRGITSM